MRMLDIEAPGLVKTESLVPEPPAVNVASCNSNAFSPAALVAAAQPAAKPYSPIVVAGMVRLIEFALVVCVRNREHCGSCDTRVPDRRNLSGAGVSRPRK